MKAIILARVLAEEQKGIEKFLNNVDKAAKEFTKYKAEYDDYGQKCN